MFQTVESTPLIVFDTETTGLDPYGADRICEIGALKVINGEVVDTFETLINPERNIPIAASQVNNITDDMVANSPTMDEVWPKFKEFIGEEGVLVAHNAKFDMDYLNAYLERAGLSKAELPECLCTMKISKNLFKGEKGHSLKALSDRLDIERDEEQSHRALYDVEVTVACLKKMIDKGGYYMIMDMMF